MNIADLKPDSRNANRGTIRGRKAVKSSLEQFGAGRSVLIDKDGALIAGNKTAEQAAAAGIQDVIVVQTDGSQLVAVQRTDLSLDDPKAQGLAVADNRTSELGIEWDAGILKDIAIDLVDLKPFFTAAELNESTGESDPEPPDPLDEWQGMPEANNVDVHGRQIIVHFKSDEDVKEFAKLLSLTISDKTKYTWYPEEQHIVARTTKYVVHDAMQDE